MAHPDEAVQPVERVESKLVSEAQLRHEQADSDLATDQEKKQAAVEQAHSLSTRPDGSYAQLHEVTGSPTLAVADEGYKAKAAEEVKASEAAVSGEAGSPAEQKAEQGKGQPSTQGQSAAVQSPGGGEAAKLKP